MVSPEATTMTQGLHHLLPSQGSQAPLTTTGQAGHAALLNLSLLIYKTCLTMPGLLRHCCKAQLANGMEIQRVMWTGGSTWCQALLQ